METDERNSSTPWLAAVVLKHYQPINDAKAIRECDGAQQLNGQWYMPLWGCDTLANLIEDIEYAAAKAANAEVSDAAPLTKKSKPANSRHSLD